MTLSEVLLLLTFVCGVAHGVFDVTWKISHDDKDHKSKKEPAQRLSCRKSNGIGCIEKLCMIRLHTKRTEQRVNIRMKPFKIAVHCWGDTPFLHAGGARRISYTRLFAGRRNLSHSVKKCRKQKMVYNHFDGENIAFQAWFVDFPHVSCIIAR